jgi:hypothetical protein
MLILFVIQLEFNAQLNNSGGINHSATNSIADNFFINKWPWFHNTI